MNKKGVVFIFIGLVILIFSAFEDKDEAAINDPDGSSPPIESFLGYVDDKMCFTCHEDIARDFKEIGMGKSFYLPDTSKNIENFNDRGYYHEASQRFYNYRWQGNELYFERFQKNTEGNAINEIEIKVDWIMGSGHKSRSYLFQTNNGEIYQLPLCWYAEGDLWRMCPGFDNANHLELLKRVRNECMFCHNAYPLETGTTGWFEHQFPHDLPEGIGCQRCHGPGGDHIDMAMEGDMDEKSLARYIVNPAKLSPHLRDDVCNQCHLQPSAEIIGRRNFERDVFSFRPGESLSDHMVHVEINTGSAPEDQRYEINHHAYRLYASKCFQLSDGELGCISCHDPHRKLPPEEKINHFKQVCTQCHTPHDVADVHLTGQITEDDCTSCHMPQTRTHDVIHVTTTDHKIRITAKGEDLLKPKREALPIIHAVRAYDMPMISDNSDLYVAISVLHSRKSADILDYVRSKIQDADSTGIRAYYYVAEAQMAVNRLDSALKTLDFLLTRIPEDPVSLEWKGLILLKQGKYNEARDFLLSAREKNPGRAEIFFNLGLYYYLTDQKKEAIDHLDQSLLLRENMFLSWYYKGQIYYDQGQYELSEKCVRRALEIDPVHSRSYLLLSDVYVKMGQKQKAISYLKHAQNVVFEKGIIAAALKELVSKITPKA